MELLSNAIESIQLGLEDYSLGTSRRMPSAVRNLHAGILLLFKEKLRRLSPPGSQDALIRSKVLPSRDKSGAVVFVGSGKKTVDVDGIRERFKSLGISADWASMKELADIRNDIEHYHPTVPPKVIQEVVAKVFNVIDTFIREELSEDPLDLLKLDAWKVLLTATDVFTRERGECETRISGVDWEYDKLAEAMLEAKCGHCGSSLIVPAGAEREAGIKCRVCSHTEDFDDAAERALAASLSWEAYVAIKDGGESPLAEFPTCMRETYLWDEDVCVLCGDSFERDCSFCGGEIPHSEFTGSDVCGYCDHMLTKDD